MRAVNLNDEIERQRRYLIQLGSSFTFPLFNSKNALESQRQSGYRNTAAAAREIVDNSIEAGASKIGIIFDRPADRKAYQRKDAVTAVAFIDNGSGMLPTMARYALSWGGGTHFEDRNFLGRFGFGLPNASINQTRRVEVYSRTAATEPWMMAWLDIDEYAGEGSVQTIHEPIQAELPTFVKRHLERAGWDLGHGTVVVWQKPDRLTYATGSSLKEHLLDDFGVTYRYLVGEVELSVETVVVQKSDPLFLDADGRYYLKPDEGGAIAIENERIPVKLVKDPKTGERHLMRVERTEDLNDPNLVAAGAVHVRVARFPLGFVVGRQTDRITPIDEFAKARFEIRKSRRGISFVRASREIETVDVFPRRPSDKASGLGDWPQLESYAYHWAMELRFDPALDEVFGITNDKQTVRPMEDLWRLLAAEEIDQLLHRENGWQSDRRREAEEQARAAMMARIDDEPLPAELAAHAAEIAIGDMPLTPEGQKKEANLAFEREAQEQAKANQTSVDEAREALRQREKSQRYRIDYRDDPGEPFYTPEWVGRQVVVWVNKSHPFFQALYGTLIQRGSARAKEAADILLFALAREELRATTPETKEFYRTQRADRWSPFIASALRTLAIEYPEAEDNAA
jgi:hypothetical protein